MFKFGREHPAFARLIAWWLLDGRDIDDLDLAFGPIDRLMQSQYQDDPSAKVDPRVLTAAMGVLILGSVVFRGYIEARNLADVPEEQIIADFARLTASLEDWNHGIAE